jgi:hypothetical protein
MDKVELEGVFSEVRLYGVLRSLYTCDSREFAAYGAAPTLPGCIERERSQGNGSPWPSVLSRWLAWVLLYLFIEVVMNSLMEGAFTSVYTPGLSPHG